jgi:hypothetical protein
VEFTPAVELPVLVECLVVVEVVELPQAATSETTHKKAVRGRTRDDFEVVDMVNIVTFSLRLHAAVVGWAS